MRVQRIVTLVALSTLAGAVPVLVGAQRHQQAAHPSGTAASGGAAAATKASGAAPASGHAAGTASATSAPAAPGVCVGPEVGQRLAQCPANAPAPTKGGGAPPSQFEQIKAKAPDKKQGPRGPSVELSTEDRTNRDRIQARQHELIERQISTLQRILHDMRHEDARRPEYLLRLAELYFELQQYWNGQARGLDEQIYQAQQANNAQRVAELTRTQQQDDQQLNGARTNAITTYATLVQDHPDYRRMDEVLFSLGYALEEMHQNDRARQVYHRLIKGYPQSRYIPNAYLSFAEYFFAEGDMHAALQFYQKVCEIPADRNPLYGYALYKQAWAYYNLQDFRGSLNQFVQTIEFANQNPDARDAANLARQSRHELVLPYAQVGNPQRALEFFQRFAQNQDQALEMFEALGELYFDTGQWPNTIAVYQKLIAEQPTGDKVCYWQSRVTNAIISSQAKPAQVREVQRLVELYEAFRGQTHPADVVSQCKAVSASIMVELATAWHREAVGTETQPGTNDRNTMQLASSLYRLVLEKFPDMQTLEFPDIDRRDWPTEYRVSYFYAELLWKMEDWGSCGPAFDHVVELNPSGEFTSDAAYAAVLCYNNVYQQQYRQNERTSRNPTTPGHTAGAAAAHHGGGRHGPDTPAADPNAQFQVREFNVTEAGMVRAFQRYICFVHDADELPRIKFQLARIYYDTNHFEEASLLYKDIATNYATSDENIGEIGANLYIDSMIFMSQNWSPQRPACLDEVKNQIDPFSALYCNTDDARAAHSTLCPRLDQLRCGILRKVAEARHNAHDFTGAADGYREIFTRFHANPEACGDDDHPGGRMDEVVWNLAIEYEAARLLGRAIRARKKIIELFPTSELAKKALYLIGANYHALALYSQAADYYEQFARRYPGEDGHTCTQQDRDNGTCTNAIEALQNATFFRLGLGDTDHAVENAHLFEQNYRTRRPQETASVIFSIGTIYEHQQNWTKAISHYRGFLSSYGRQAMPQQIIRANVQIAHAYWVQNDRPHAQPFFTAAVAAWEHGAANNIAQLPGASDEDKAGYLREAKLATAEALFYLSEYLYAAYERIAFPVYHGGHRAADVTTWAQGAFATWLQSKIAALHAAEESYNRVRTTFCAADQQQCLEVPQWQIASAARAGEMYRVFVDAFEDAPVPEEIENDDELYQIYVGELNRQRQIFFDQAIPRFQFCLQTATLVRWFNEFSQQCERELYGLDPAHYPLAAELRGEPTYVQAVSARPGPIELGSAAGQSDEDATSGND